MTLCIKHKAHAAAMALSMAALAIQANGAYIYNGPGPASGQSVEELRELVDALGLQLRNVNNQTRSITGRADAAGRDLSAAEIEKVDALTAKFNAIAAEIQIAKQELADAEQEAIDSTPQGRRTAPNAIANSTGRAARVNLAGFAEPVRNFTGMFPGQADPYNGAFESFSQFALAVARGNDGRLIRNDYAPGSQSSTESGASAGFLVPQAFVQRLMDAALQQEVFRPRATVIPISTGNAIVSGFKTTDGTGNKRAGLYLDWMNPEGSQLQAQKPVAQEIQSRATKAAIFCRVTAELAADAPNFDAMLSSAMTAAVAAGLDSAFINGSGAGQPLGVINAPATIIVSKESGQASNTLLLANLAKIVGRLMPASFARSVWFVHPTLVPTLYQMSYVVKNVAGSENVGGSFVPAVSHDADGNLTIFGRPALVTDACSVLSSKGDIVLADPTRYLVMMRSDVRLVRDQSVYFDTDEIAFKLTMRFDGLPQDSEPTKLRDGTNTVSPFVVLEAR